MTDFVQFYNNPSYTGHFLLQPSLMAMRWEGFTFSSYKSQGALALLVETITKVAYAVLGLLLFVISLPLTALGLCVKTGSYCLSSQDDQAYRDALPIAPQKSHPSETTPTMPKIPQDKGKTPLAPSPNNNNAASQQQNSASLPPSWQGISVYNDEAGSSSSQVCEQPDTQLFLKEPKLLEMENKGDCLIYSILYNLFLKNSLKVDIQLPQDMHEASRRTRLIEHVRERISEYIVTHIQKNNQKLEEAVASSLVNYYEKAAKDLSDQLKNIEKIEKSNGVQKPRDQVQKSTAEIRREMGEQNDKFTIACSLTDVFDLEKALPLILEYTDKVTRLGFLADNAEICALAYLYDATIYVYSVQNSNVSLTNVEPKIYNSGKGPERTLRIQFNVRERHYDVIHLDSN